jgi:ABC-type antimicrobial peptide transport system permease subunit
MLFNAEGTPAPEPRGVYTAYSRLPVPGYFQSIGQPLLQGRDFLESDKADAPLVCIISQSIAHRFWPNDSPLGKRIRSGRLDGARPWFTVVGVVRDTKAVADPQDGEVVGMIARPLAQMLVQSTAGLDDITFVVHVPKATIAEAALRAAVTRAEPRLATYSFIWLHDAVARSRTTERFVFVLISAFAVLGLTLAAIGLYGLLAFQVARRQREFGIRSALGATGRQIMELVARQGAYLLALGFAAGALVTSACFRLIQHYWAQMPTPNLIAWLGGIVVLCVTVALACWIPARRASQVNPIVALRAE